MQKLALILTLISMAGCSLNPGGQEVSQPSFKAVYFFQKEAQLSSEDLQAHSEVATVQTFNEFQKYAHQKLALWIDKSATPFDSAQQEWINEAPQAYYPIVLVGTSDTLYAFRDLLRLCCFLGPAGTYPGFDAPGFSIIQRKPPADPNTTPMDVSFIHGYAQRPTVQSILEITNDLLEGNLRPTPISTLPKPAKQIAPSETHQIILYDEEPRDGFPNDAAKINTLSLDGNILTIDVACQEHTFELYAWTAFLESNPPQGVFFLSHDSQGDACTENMEQELSFDLTPLNQERTDPREHPLLLRIIEPAGGSFAREPVMPLIEWP